MSGAKPVTVVSSHVGGGIRTVNSMTSGWLAARANTKNEGSNFAHEGEVLGD